jgi:hypothetical protein
VRLRRPHTAAAAAKLLFTLMLLPSRSPSLSADCHGGNRRLYALLSGLFAVCRECGFAAAGNDS